MEYLAFRKMAHSLISIDAILLNPGTVKIPSKPDELFATVVGLAAKANPVNMGQVITYLHRLNDPKEFKDGHARGEFAALCMRDTLRHDPSLQNTKAFGEAVCGPLGALMNGEVN